MKRNQRMQRKAMKNKYLKASFTIEASVIVPLAMMMITVVVMVSFALHDRILLQTALVFEVMDHAKGFTEEPEEAASNAEALLEKRLTVAKDIKVLVEEEKDGTRTSAEGRIPIPGGLIRRISGSAFEKAEVQAMIANLDGRKALIEYKTICDGVSALGNSQKEAEAKKE